MRHFGNDKMSEKWYDIKRDIERLIESIEDAQPQDAETFGTFEDFKTQLMGMKTVTVEKLIKALQEDN